jgi:hypothetical protein
MKFAEVIREVETEMKPECERERELFPKKLSNLFRIV